MREEHGISEAGAQSGMGRVTSKETRFIGKGVMMWGFHSLANKFTVHSKSNREPLVSFKMRNADEWK